MTARSPVAPWLGLLLVTACGDSGERARALDPGEGTARERVVLEERLQPTQGQPVGERLPWPAGVDLVERGGRRAQRVGAGERAELRLGAAVDLEHTGAVAVRVSAPRATELALRLVRLEESGRTPLGAIRTELEAGAGGARLIRFPLPLPEPGQAPAAELALVLKADRLEGVLVEEPIRASAPPPVWRRIVDGGNAAGPLALDGQRRFAHVATRGRALVGTARVAGPDARLSFGFGAVGAGTAKLRVRIGDGAAAELPVEELGVWRAADLPLTGAAGALVPVEIELVPEAGSALWVAIEPPIVSTRTRRPPTVLLVTSDTHRGDHLGAARQGVPIETPALDALAARGVLFEDCFASTHVTLPSHAAMFTGTHPRDSGVGDNETRLADEAPTLAEAYHEAGYLTWAAVSLSLLTDGYSGLGQGFDRLDAPARRRDSEDTVERAIEWLDEAEGRALFLWVHVFDAHTPYKPPKPYDRRFFHGEHDPFDPALPEELTEGMTPPDWIPDVRDAEYVRALYRGEIGHEDEQLRRLLEHPRMADAVVALVGDHGECLGQHDSWWRHRGLYPDTLHVPLILSWPGAPRGKRVADPVRSLDLGRTLLDLAELSAVAFPGRDILSELERGDAAVRPRFALSTGRLLASVSLGGRHLIQRLGSSHEIELYDLSIDPECTHDLIDERPDEARELRSLVLEWLAAEDQGRWGSATEVDRDTAEHLAELGYADQGEERSGTALPADCDCAWCVRFR
jgi:arylsulfatase A-like enzyme